MLALAMFVLMLGLPALALAHGVLRRSAPANGAHLADAPRELRLTFNENVELAVARLQLIGPDSADVVLGPPTLAADSPVVLVAPIQGGLKAGSYTVAWQIAGADGHPVRGRYSFVIAPGARGLAAPAGPTAPGQASPPASHHNPVSLPSGPGFDAESPLYVAVRWLTYLGLLGVLGSLAFRLAVLPLVKRQGTLAALALLGPAGVRAARVGLVSAGVVAVAAVLRLYAQSYALHGAAGALEWGLVGTMLSRTLWGWGWILQATGTLLAITGFAAARQPAREVSPAQRVEPNDALAQDSPRIADGGTLVAAHPSVVQRPSIRPVERPSGGWILAALGGVALAFAPALSGHAASVPGVAALAVLADGVHVLGAGGWVGGLLLVVVVGVPVAMDLKKEQRGPAVAALVNAFSPTALLFAGALTLTGLYAAWLHLGRIPALWDTGYGRTLLLKLGVLSVVFGTGAYNWLRLKPALGDEVGATRLRRSATVEIATGILVLLVTAVLVATATPAAM
jgi:putative copper export protein/methionine-rich copper-binding protein CopC